MAAEEMSDDDAMAALGGFGEQGGDVLKDLGLRAFEALGELLKCFRLHADEVCGAVRFGRMGRLGHCG